MTYEELKIQLDINDPIGVLDVVGKLYADNKWFVVCDEGDCHLLDSNGNECNIREVIEISARIVPNNVKKVIITDAVTSIGWRAFFGCSSLMNIVIPSSVINIGAWAFDSCISLANITIPNGVTSIEEYAFYGCSGLTSVTIGNGVPSIGPYAFDGCTNLKDIIFEGKTIEEAKQMENYSWGIKDESIIKCKS